LLTLFVCRRPRITISIIAPNHALDSQILSYELPAELSLGDLKAFISAETDLPPNTQQFYLNNQIINGDGKTLQEAGIKDDDLLALLIREPNQQNNATNNNTMGGQRRPQQAQRQGRPPNMGADEIESTRMGLLSNPAAMAQVREQRPALAQAINDSNRFREVWQDMICEDDDRERERQEQMRLLNEDPFNVDAQRKIEEIIRQQSVQENLQHAYEHNPEGRSKSTNHHSIGNTHTNYNSQSSVA
jgi:DNA damage-inducible protein 1